MERNKSITRAKKSATSIVELLAKEGVSAVVPGGKLMYDVAKVLVNHGKNYFSDRTACRIEDFHSALLMGNADHEKFEHFLNAPFELDDYYAVLSSCVQDIEAEKVDIYSSLMKSLIESKLDHELRRHFIKSCKELNYAELNFLKLLYINKKHDLMTVGETKQQVEALLSTKDALRMLAIEKLKSFGFIAATGNAITPLAEQFVNTIFSDEKLIPDAIGKKEFSGIKVVIVTYQLDDPAHVRIATEAQEALWSCQIKSSIQIIDKTTFANSMIPYSAALLIVGDKPIEPKYISALSKFSEKRPVIRLNIVDAATNNGLEEITFSGELNFTSESNSSVREMVREYIEQLAKQAQPQRPSALDSLR